MDEQMLQALAMDEMMGGGAPAPAGGMGDPFASDAPPGYTMVYVPDAVLPAVMELVESADFGAAGLGDPMAAPAGPPMGEMPLY